MWYSISNLNEEDELVYFKIDFSRDVSIQYKPIQLWYQTTQHKTLRLVFGKRYVIYYDGIRTRYKNNLLQSHGLA